MQPVSIIIPVYNEVRGLPATLERLRALLERLPPGSEAVLVDDGSTDGTSAIVESAAGGALRALRHARNRGYGAALKTGIAEARNELVGICDADGTYPLERLRAMVRLLEIERAAMVVGARPGKDQAAARRFAKWFLRRLAQYLSGERIPDLNSGLRVFRRADALRHRALLPDGFSFTTTITMALLTEGEKVVFVPIRYKRRVGRSKIKPVRDTANFLLLICRTAMAFHPLKVFGPVGLGLMGVGSAMLAARFLLDNPFGVATTIFLLVSGLQVLAMGLLADLVNRRR